MSHDNSARRASVLEEVMGAIEIWPRYCVAIAVSSHKGTVMAGETTKIFPWASVTKVLTSFALLLAYEEGTVSLDEPVGLDGLADEVSIRHLLSHSSGLGPNQSVRTKSPISLPARYSIPTDEQPLAPCGTKRIYSNLGFDLLAKVLQERAEMRFFDYLQEGILDPLKIEMSEFGDGSSSPAWGAKATISELITLAREFLYPHLLAPETVEIARTVQFPGLSGVLPGYGLQANNDWGLGLEIKDSKSPHWTGSMNTPEAFGHFGQSGSFVWIDPKLELCFAYLSERPFDNWAKEHWPTISDYVIELFS